MQKIEETIYKNCPNCGIKWSLKEYDWQECETCDYPDSEVMMQRLSEFDDFDDFDDFEDLDDDR